MWEWREDTARGRWRLGATGSWLWDEPSDLDRYAEGYEGLTRPLPLGVAATTLPETGPDGSSWIGSPSWTGPAWVGSGPASATPSWLAERSWLPVDDATIGSRPYLDDAASRPGEGWPGEGWPGEGWHGEGWRWVPDDGTVAVGPEHAPVHAEPTPIFEAVAEDRDGGGGAHAADGPRGEHPAIPSPTPGSGPLPVQRLEALRGADSPEEELRRRAERRRRPLVTAVPEPGRHALAAAGAVRDGAGDADGSPAGEDPRRGSARHGRG